MKIASSIGTPI
ncbi:hypothetical protein LINGRAHAP2_LOCUS4446 [Linum grandiflorum]